MDRTRFLMLTGVIAAAAACTTAAVTTTSDGGASNGGDDAGNANDSGQTPVVEGGSDAAPGTDGGNDGAVVACLGSAGDASACAPFADGGGVATTCLNAQVCNGASNVTSGVAASIIACVSADTTIDSGCVDLSTCVLAALGSACADPATASPCGAIVTACGPDSGAGIADGGIAVTQASCEQYLAGLTGSARDAFSACMVEGACNLSACATGLF